MAALRDTSPIVAAILDGEHDDVLRHIARATDWRLKQVARESGLRPGSRIVVSDDAKISAEFAGRTGTVERVNPKTVSVELDPLDENDDRTNWRLPHSWLEVAP
jgi:hypothetical protein